MPSGIWFPGARPTAWLSIWLTIGVVLTAPATPAPAQYAPMGSLPLTGTDPVNSHPYGLAFHPTAPLGYVALAGVTDFTQPPVATNGSTVAEFDLGTLQITRTFAVGLYPTEIAIAPDGSQLYVACSTDSTVAFVDLVSTTVTQVPITDSTGGTVSFVSGIALSADGTQLLVASNGGDLDGSDENVVVLDRATGTIVGRQVLAGSVSRFGVLADGRAVVPVGFPGNDFTALPEVRIYDTAVSPWGLLATLPLIVDTTTFPAPVDVAISPDETRAYVTVFEGSSDVFVVDLVTNTLLPPIVLPTLDFVQHGIGLSPDGAQLFVTDFFQSQARVVDVATGAVTATLATGSQPNEAMVDGGRLWITDQGSQTITLYALPGSYLRGDVDDDGGVSLTDAVALLMHLFVTPTLSCLDRGDIDDDGQLDLTDPVALLTYLFNGGATPAYPFPGRGADRTGDGLSCP